jgi:aminoglycoside 2''-phosphotransferase
VNFSRIVSEIEAQTGIKARDVRRVEAGWEYLVLLVNGKFVFRVPRSQGRRSRLEKEVALVRSLSKRITTPVPKYEYVDRKGGPPSFAGYQRLGGLPCTARNYRSSWTDGLAHGLGTFLFELHNLRLPLRVAAEVKAYTPKAWAARFLRVHEDARKFAYPLLSQSDRDDAEGIWAELHSALEAADFAPSLIHGDLMGGNILYDPVAWRLSGVIDWSDAMISDPAYDFAGLFSVTRRLAESTLGSYKRTKAGFIERAELYFRTIPIREIAWGAKVGYQRAVKIGLSEFARWIRDASFVNTRC